MKRKRNQNKKTFSKEYLSKQKKEERSLSLCLSCFCLFFLSLSRARERDLLFCYLLFCLITLSLSSALSFLANMLLAIVPHIEFIAGFSEPSWKNGPYPGLGSRHEAVSVAFKTFASACEITPTRTPTSMQRLTVGSVSGSHSAGGTFPDCSC